MNEHDNNFNITQSKAYMKYILPNVNNSNELKTKGGSLIILSEQLHKHLKITEILHQRHYIIMTFNFKNKSKIHVHSIYLSNYKIKHQTTFNEIITKLYNCLDKQLSKYNHTTLLLGDFNISQLSQQVSLRDIIGRDYLINLSTKFGLKNELTHYPGDLNKSSLVIDYIFGLQNLCNSITEFNILNENFYFSDHSIIKISIDHPNANLIRNKNSKFKRDTNSNKENQYNTKK
ncbi:hypothetical protein C1646_774980 [Rhizophagus diaphanus]|nr:hypothetical protein C1646_774980 [Rhizophagus diaphanus] [Rhizophagus sp. MUCL 43196]